PCRRYSFPPPSRVAMRRYAPSLPALPHLPHRRTTLYITRTIHSPRHTPPESGRGREGRDGSREGWTWGRCGEEMLKGWGVGVLKWARCNCGCVYVFTCLGVYVGHRFTLKLNKFTSVLNTTHAHSL